MVSKTKVNSDIEQFAQTVKAFYQSHGRSMPWRDKTEAYWVLVSEIMLQQTQVDRVIPKFISFINQFPDIASLAASPQSAVLKAWSGLGYNRRARFVHQAAQKIMQQHHGQVPKAVDELVALPGVGVNTAGAILAYAYNQPVVFIETNIRTVYLHHFFHGKHEVFDTELRPLIESTLDHQNPREWYWALMDYGSYLKKQRLGAIAGSKHYVKQSRFSGSERELRGQILKLLATKPHTTTTLAKMFPDNRLPKILQALQHEHLITYSGKHYKLTD